MYCLSAGIWDAAQRRPCHSAGMTEQTTAPAQTEPDEDSTLWGAIKWAASAVATFIVAGLVMTPLWAQIEGKDTGRRAGFARLLESIGQTNVALIFAAIGAICLAFGVVAFVRSRRA